LQGFCKESVANHLFRWTVFDGEFVAVDAIRDEIELTIEMFGSLAA
jgi:hypothetical protein